MSAFLVSANIALGFMVAAVLARILGASGYGVYSLFAVSCSVLAMFTQLGIPKLAMRETARALELKEFSRMHVLWRWAGTRVIGLSVAASLVPLVVLYLIPVDVLPGDPVSYMLGALLIPLVSLGALRGAILRGLGHVILGQLPEAGLRNLVLLTLLLGIWYFAFPSTPVMAMGANVTATLIAFMFGAWLLYTRTPPELLSAKMDAPIDKTWVKAAALMALSAGLNQINNYADILILGVFRPSDEVGIYRIVYQVSTLAILGLQAVSLIAAPRFAKAHAKADHSALQSLVQLSSRMAVLVALPVALIFFLAGSQILSNVFGDEFETGHRTLLILASAQVVNASFGSIGVLMNMTRHEADLTRAMGISACVNLALNFALIPLFGMTGAAISTLTSITVWNSLLFLSAKRKLGVTSHVFSVGSGVT